MPRLKKTINKRKVNLYLDKEIVEEAMELGLNLSKICENSLYTAILALKEAGFSSRSPKKEE